MFVPVCRAPVKWLSGGERKNWNRLEESNDAPLDLLSSGEIVPCF